MPWRVDVTAEFVGRIYILHTWKTVMLHNIITRFYYHDVGGEFHVSQLTTASDPVQAVLVARLGVLEHCWAKVWMGI